MALVPIDPVAPNKVTERTAGAKASVWPIGTPNIPITIPTMRALALKTRL